MLHSPQAHLPGPVPSPSLPSVKQRERQAEPTSSDDISRRNSPLLPSSKPLQKQTPPVKTFASLSSPQPEQPPFLLEVPDSTSFSSLVERPSKRKRTSNLGLVSHNEAYANPLSPTFAVRTSVRQNWYQPSLKQRKRSYNDKNPDPSPSKMESFVSPTKMFRSGTLQIKPTSLSEEFKANLALPSGANRQNNLATRSQSLYDLFSQSPHDSSDPSEIDSYRALQTQAPYQSQISTQV